MARRGKRRENVRLLNTKRKSGLFLFDGEYIADIKPDDGRRIRRRLGADRDCAFVLFEALLEELQTGDEKPRVADFLNTRFLPTQSRLKSYESSVKTVRAIIRFLDATAPTLRIDAVQRPLVEQMRTFYADHAPRSVNAYQQKLSQALNYAVDLGLIDNNPTARVKPLPVDNRRTKFLTLDQFVRIIRESANTDAHDLFLVIALTGLRPSNVRLLTASEVDGAMLRIPPEKMKNQRRGEIPVSRFVANFLAERIDSSANDPDVLLFPAMGTDNGPKGSRNLRRAFAAAAKRAGCDEFTPYDLRHFFATQLARQGATDSQIGRLLCHVGQSVTSRYVHYEIEDLRRFVEGHSQNVVEALDLDSAHPATSHREDDTAGDSSIAEDSVYRRRTRA